MNKLEERISNLETKLDRIEGLLQILVDQKTETIPKVEKVEVKKDIYSKSSNEIINGEIHRPTQEELESLFESIPVIQESVEDKEK